ncbi:hypothetical protein MMC30_004883 [Trapelia coarctata]|nr:hypothetical protein [Trapelia coarctata]
MSLHTTSTTTAVPTPQFPSSTNVHHELLPSAARRALSLATNYAFDQAETDGHWCGEVHSNATITAEYVFLGQALGLDLACDRDALCRWFFSEQKEDGSWTIAPDYPGDVSTTTEVYLALKILNVSAEDPAMRRARDFVISVGGVAKVRVLTRIYLATFGLFPWNAVPQLPTELILMPAMAPINIYRLSSWARGTIVPLLIVCHHQPIYELPNGTSAENNFLDELWCDAFSKMAPYSLSLWDSWKTDGTAFAFTAIDKILYLLSGLRFFPLRSYARRQCVTWILEHQEESGDWAGVFPPLHVCLLALTLEGFDFKERPISRGLEAVGRFAWHDEGGKRIQASVSPVWDTVLMTVALCDAGLAKSDEHLTRAVGWIKSHQLLGIQGDWRIYNPRLQPGGFSFEYFNTWYPDVDDTAVAILAFVKRDPDSMGSRCVIRAAEWILGMQNLDGGWAAFDMNNDKLFLNKIPLSDMGNLCDPSTADVTGRILEAFGLMMKIARKEYAAQGLLKRMGSACERAITYLAAIQESTGAWYGRWGSNYVYGTSNTLGGLAYFSENDPSVQSLVLPAIQWLKSVQNTDGGWGEDLNTYKHPERAGCGVSTASQTAWGVMALLSQLPPTDEAINRGVRFLVSSQTNREKEGASWEERQYTGTGFPNHFYLGYAFYRHYFPMMALGRYVQATDRLAVENGQY